MKVWLYSLWFCLRSFQSKRRAPILTAPREDHRIQQTVSENTPAHKIPSAGMYPTKHYSEFSNVLKAFPGESKSLSGGTELAVKEDKENSAPVGSCRRVGLRRVGLGKSREPPKNQLEFCQTREGIHEKQDRYRPPTVPSYMSGTLSGDVSNFSFITFTFDGLWLSFNLEKMTALVFLSTKTPTRGLGDKRQWFVWNCP